MEQVKTTGPGATWRLARFRLFETGLLAERCRKQLANRALRYVNQAKLAVGFLKGRQKIFQIMLCKRALDYFSAAQNIAFLNSRL